VTVDLVGSVAETPAELHSRLRREAKALAPAQAAKALSSHPPAVVAGVLQGLNPSHALNILVALPPAYAEEVERATPPETARQWERNRTFPDGTIGRLMEPALAVLQPDMTVGATVEQLRTLVKTALITYVYVTNAAGRLVGLITMRDLLFAPADALLETLMLRNVFCLRPTQPLAEAMRMVLDRHYPVYPVCDENDVLIGTVRGQAMFEEQAIEITAQVGSMVGVEKEERLATPFGKSFKLRHPWLQLNLLTAFAAGAVVGVFQDTIDRLVILALFLPVLAGQSGNTGCQSLAVTLRGMTLGELKPGTERELIAKEAWLGLSNGALTGLVAAIGMYVVATMQHNPNAVLLAAVVWLALVGSCIASGLCGAMIPLTLKRLGADPATASSIFLTTATDIVSMGLLLGFATLFIH
jgi:magnesium transporter